MWIFQLPFTEYRSCDIMNVHCPTDITFINYLTHVMLEAQNLISRMPRAVSKILILGVIGQYWLNSGTTNRFFKQIKLDMTSMTYTFKICHEHLFVIVLEQHDDSDKLISKYIIVTYFVSAIYYFMITFPACHG